MSVSIGVLLGKDDTSELAAAIERHFTKTFPEVPLCVSIVISAATPTTNIEVSFRLARGFRESAQYDYHVKANVNGHENVHGGFSSIGGEDLRGTLGIYGVSMQRAVGLALDNAAIHIFSGTTNRNIKVDIHEMPKNEWGARGREKGGDSVIADAAEKAIDKLFEVKNKKFRDNFYV